SSPPLARRGRRAGATRGERRLTAAGRTSMIDKGHRPPPGARPPGDPSHSPAGAEEAPAAPPAPPPPPPPTAPPPPPPHGATGPGRGGSRRPGAALLRGLRGAGGAGAGRHGHRLPGPPEEPQPRRRPQGHPRRPARLAAGRAPLPPGGGGRRPPRPPPPRAG